MAEIDLATRRTYSVHHTEGEAMQAVHNLARLMNGVPVGYVFALLPKMGKVAFVSYAVKP